MTTSTRTWEPAVERYGPITTVDPRFNDPASVKFQANVWLRSDLDYMVTLSPSQVAHDRCGFGNPHKLMRFMLKALESADYWGPYVMVIGENRGTAYWHPHLLCKGTENGRRIEDILRRFGNLGSAFDGPLRGAGAFTYLAGRACENPFEMPYVAERLRWVRKPRPHGRGDRRHA